VVQIEGEKTGKEAADLFGGFSFRAPVWEKAGIIYTKAADDLVGCFAILETFKKLKGNGSSKMLGLLTRAEEVGFVGCIAHVEQGLWKKANCPLLVVSLETSRTLPGALVGKGPVVRLGDRASLFTPSAIEVLVQVAQKKLKGRFQKRIMDGGTCEATVAVAHQIPAIGISIPLGNYHNQGFEGGMDCKTKDGPAPEFVSLKDIQGMLNLCEGLLEEGLSWNDPWEKKRKQLSQYLIEGKKYL
jgi:endoglucanase